MNGFAKVTRRGALVGVLAAAGMLAAAGAGYTETAPQAHAATSTPRCHTSGLLAELRTVSSGKGQNTDVLRLTNVSPTTCHARGHVGLGLLGPWINPVPTNAVWTGGPGDTVTLGPGEAAWTELRWSASPGPGEPTSGFCEPLPGYVEVTPPDEYTHLTVRWRYAPVCDKGRIETTPLEPGLGAQRTSSWGGRSCGVSGSASAAIPR